MPLPFKALATLFLLTASLAAQTPESSGATIRVNANAVLVPAMVEYKGDILSGLTPQQFVLEDNGVPQKIKVDDDPGPAGLSLVVAVQCSRSAVMEMDKMAGLPAMIEGLVGAAPFELAVVAYGDRPHLVQDFSSNMAEVHSALVNLQPCDEGSVATMDTVNYASTLLGARTSSYRRAIVLISETRDHGSRIKPEKVIASLGRTNTVVDAVSFSPGKTEFLDDLHYGGGGGGLLSALVMAVNAMKKNAAHELANLSGGQYINFTTQKGFDQGLNRLTNHIHNYYLLSFQPTAPADGLHTIRVRIPDYPDAKISARESYWVGN